MDERERVRGAMERALSGLREDPQLQARIIRDGREQVDMKKKTPVGALIVLMALLAAMTAALAANETGLLALLRGSGYDLPSAAQELVAVSPEQQTLAWAYAQVEALETLRAWDWAQALLRLAPEKAGTLLVPEEWLGTDRMPSADGRQVIALRAHAPSLRSADGSSFPAQSWRVEYLPQEDGSLHALLYMADDFSSVPDGLRVFMRFETIPAQRTTAGWQLEKGAQKPANIAFTLPALPPESPLTFAAAGTGLPLLIPDCGLRIDRVSLSGTALYTDVTVAYTVVDEAAYRAPGADGLPRVLMVAVRDGDGEPFARGMKLHSDQETEGLACSVSVAPMAEAPERLQVVVYEFGRMGPVACVTIPLEATE